MSKVIIALSMVFAVAQNFALWAAFLVVGIIMDIIERDIKNRCPKCGGPTSNFGKCGKCLLQDKWNP